MSEIYAACDVMYVPLAPGLSADAYAVEGLSGVGGGASGSSRRHPRIRPVTALVRESHAGFTVDPLTAEGVAAAIRSIDAKQLAEMGRRVVTSFDSTTHEQPRRRDYVRIVEAL